MLFEYDENKSIKNKLKHGIDFEEAKALWENENALLLHQLNTQMFERARRDEMCSKKSVGLPVGNSKIFLRAGRLVSLSPKGAALLPILCVRFS